jgi:hypothetical protein
MMYMYSTYSVYVGKLNNRKKKCQKGARQCHDMSLVVWFYDSDLEV